MPVKFGDLLLAYEFASFQGAGETAAYLCKSTGKIFMHSDMADEVEELPDDIDDREKYVVIPDKRDLDLGTRLVFRFVREFLPNDYDEVSRLFSRKGAYAGFRNLLHRRHAVGHWHDFENKATKAALREWCDSESIEIMD